MVKGICGYGRYDDAPNHVGCPRANSDITPCIARDGATALADDLMCVGCNMNPKDLLNELDRAGVSVPTYSPVIGQRSQQNAADKLRAIVSRETMKLMQPRRKNDG